jgi:nucleotide sugar dehydrogenase
VSASHRTVSVIGAGKMGLPVACVFASRGARVIVCDVNSVMVDGINRGISPIDEPGVQDLLAAGVRSGALRATTNTAAAAAASDVVVILVPVLLTPSLDADLAIIESVAETLATSIRPGTMVIVETTLPVGGTRRLGAIIERGGLVAGRDFDLVFSPERVKSRFVLRNLQINPKVVGGGTAEAGARAAAFYADFLGAPVDNVGSLETAEFTKLAGMVYRDVNIALANELAMYAELRPIDFERARQAANTDGEAAILSPGIGVGGHCTPVYPHFLIHDAIERGAPARLAILGREINDFQPEHALDRIEAAIGPLAGRRVAILGLGFRPGVKEHTNSPAFAVFDHLRKRGADPIVVDPLYPDDEIVARGLQPGPLAGAEIAILVTGHELFRDLLPELAASGCQLVFDGRGFWARALAEQAGLTYLAPGSG